MLYRYQSHHLYNIFYSWSENVRNLSNSNVLSPATVVVPNMDLAQWLKVHQAEQEGICANIQFELPAAFLKRLFLVRHTIGNHQLLDKKNLRWMIFTLLGDAALSGTHSDEWSNLIAWIKRGKSQIEQKSLRWELSGQIADVYDQYILFRPDWLESWAPTNFVKLIQTELPELDNQNGWQPSLWLALRKRWPNVSTRSELLLELIESLKFNERVGSYHLPDAIHVIGISTLSGAMTEALILLSKHIDVHWYQLNNETFESVESTEKKNPFFYNLQRNQRDYVGLLSQIVQRNNIIVNDISVKNSIALRSDNPLKSTLSSIKENILNPDSKLNIVVDDFESYSIHRCHSARREVEILHDRLLYLFEKNDFRPGDVAIVSPDPDLYAPFIKEVFNSVETGKPTIPIRISGQSQSEISVIADILINGLSLATSRFKSTEVLEWLRYGPVLGDILDEAGLHNTLQRWIIDQRIRWGSYKEHVIELGFDLEGRHTWKHGLDRLLLSWMTSEDQDVVFDKILSGSAVLTQNEIRLLSRLMNVFEVLDEIRQSAKKENTATEWRDLINRFIDEIFGEDSEYKRSISTIKSSLLQLLRLEEENVLTEPISFQVVKDYLSEFLDKSGLGRSWHPGYVTFTGMVALHQIPYKMVAIIGLNDGSMPGRSSVSTFDLLSNRYRPGDRVRRQSDQQLFLDYVLTTETCLHLSYTGLRQTDNKPLTPSVMITMMQDFLKLNWSDKSDYIHSLVYQHHLQPFHKEYFQSDSNMPSYSKRNATLSQNMNSLPQVNDWIIPEEDLFAKKDEVVDLTVDELVSFYRNSTRYVLRNIHRIDLYESDIPDSDEEPFELNHLVFWQIRTEIIRRLLRGNLEQPQNFKRELELKGVLPDAIAGELSMDKINEQLKSVQSEIEKTGIDISLFSPLELDLVKDVNGRQVHIKGNVGLVYENVALFADASSNKPKHCLRIWVQHILINLVKPVESCVIFNDATLIFRELKYEEASIRLNNLLWFYLMAQNSLAPVFPECANVYNKMLKESGNAGEQAANAILEAILERSDEDSGSYTPNYVKELSDEWVNLAFGDKNPLLNRTSDMSDLADLSLMTHAAFKEGELITENDFRTFEHFTVFAVKVMEIMQEDVTERRGDGK